MHSIRSKKQLESDLTVFFGAYREQSPEKKEDKTFNMGIGEINSKNNLLCELKSYAGLLLRDITKSIRTYPGCQGYKPLNEKIAELINMETGLNINSEEIILTGGAYDSITQAIFAFSNPKDKVIYPVPSFPYWSSLIRSSSKGLPIYCNSPKEYSDNFSGLIKNKIDKTVSMIILNNPHNPLGSSIKKEQAEIINSLALKNNSRILLDDVYRAFSKEKWIGSYFDLDNTIIADSLSKRFGIPGLRLGFIRLPKKDLKYFRASCANQHVGISSAVAIIADYLLDIYLNNKNLNNIPREINRRQEKLDTCLKKIKKYGLYSPKPIGGMFRVIYCRNSEYLKKRLKEKGLILKTQKESFPYLLNKNNNPEFIRLSVGGEKRIKEAMEVFYGVLKNQNIYFLKENSNAKKHCISNIFNEFKDLNEVKQDGKV